MFRQSLQIGFGITLLSLALSAAEIPQGAHLLLRMQNSVNTRTAQEGDYVYLQTATPVAAGGAIVIPVGTYVQGVVAHVKRPGKVKGKGELGIRLETFTLPDGRVVKMTARVASVDGAATGQKVSGNEGTVESGSGVGQDASRIAIITGQGAVIGTMAGAITNRSAGGIAQGAGIGAGIGAAAGAITTLLTRGPEATLTQGMSVDIVFDQPITVE